MLLRMKIRILPARANLSLFSGATICKTVPPMLSDRCLYCRRLVVARLQLIG